MHILTMVLFFLLLVILLRARYLIIDKLFPSKWKFTLRQNRVQENLKELLALFVGRDLVRTFRKYIISADGFIGFVSSF